MTSEHVEVTLRITFAMLICYSVSFVGAPVGLNANIQLLLPIIGPFVILLMPTLMFAYGGIILPMAVLFMMAYFFTTLLLMAAVSGGDAGFCGLMAVFLLWMSFLRWEKATGPGTSILIISVLFVSILVFPNYKVVQNGFDVVVKLGEGPDDPVASTLLPRNTIPEYLSNYFSQTIVDNLSGADAGEFLEIQSSTSDLSGLVVEHLGTIEDTNYATFHVPGGMWMVQAIWTATGVNNPLALFYNLFIFWGWLFFSLAIVYFIPPFRTLRFALSKGMIPSALNDASTLIELHSNQISKEKGDENGGDEDTTKKKGQLKGSLVRHTNVLFGGNLAKLTAFEPRLSTVGSSLPVCTWFRLKGVSDAALKCVLVAIGIEELVHENDGPELIELTKIHVEATKSLKSCALALQTGKTSFINEEGLEKDSSSDPFRMKVHTKAVVDSTKSYVMAMDGKTSENDSHSFFSKKTWMEVKLSMLPFYVVFTAYPLGMLNVVRMLCRKGYWSSLKVTQNGELNKLMWCIKYTAGFVILLVMSLYWDHYNENFHVSTTLPKESYGAVLSSLNSGWAMIAYCFATTQSTEGSVKKGILRGLGTVFGGFFGWLALLACEDSRFEAGFNPYGLVAWMTITTAGATFSATNRGFFARLGLSGDYSFGPIYFIITEIIVVMYCYLFFGPEGRNDVAINRIVANLVGIAVGILMAIVPPGVWGGDPSHCREIADKIEGNSSEYLDILLKSQGITDASELEKISKELLKKKDLDLAAGIRLHGLAKDVYDDASRFSAAPFLKTDGGLTLELALISRDVYVSSYLGVLAARIVSNPNFRRVALEDETVRSSIVSYKQIFQNRQSHESSPAKNTPQSLVSDLEGGDGDEMTEAKLLVELFLRLSKMIQQRVQSHHRALDQIKWGYTFSSKPKENDEVEAAV